MAIFSETHLEILKRINNTYNLQGAGIEFSSYKAVSDPAKTNKLNDNYTNGPIAGTRYSGSSLFDTLYGNHHGARYPYSWKTGWGGNRDNGTQTCRLLFGIIPIFWSNANTGTEETSTTVYKTGSTYNTTDTLKSFVNTFFNQNEVNAITKNVDYYKVVDGQADKDLDGKDTDTSNRETFELLTIKNAIGLGVNINFMHNYKSCDFSIKDYKIINHRQDERYKWWDIEKTGISGYKWLPEYRSVMPRIGAIITKNNTIPSQPVLENVPAFGYYRYKNGDPNQYVGKIDDTDVTYTNPNNSTVNYASWQQYISQIGGNMTNDGFFGSINTLGNNAALFNNILDNLITYYSPNKQYINDSQFFLADGFNMFEYDTIQYNCYNNSKMHIVPVFANSVRNITDSTPTGGACCLINTFQSIVYNSYINEAIDTGRFGIADNDIRNANTRCNRLNTNQSDNTYNGYNGTSGKFVMKYDSENHGVYLSFALKFTCDSNGNPTGITSGKTIAGETDWIAWINGNIYVIPQLMFKKFVFYSPSDFELLNGMF